jgi:WD40 repeat protein/serine/threonine protein kinase
MDLPDRIGRYRVEALVGTGGFALVVRAEDETLQDTVAIKVLAEHWAEDADIRDRFLEEARLLRRTGNDDVVTVHDIGELGDGRPYFVMDYANRGTLADRLAGRPSSGLDISSARAIATTLAGGLDALHRAGVVHRDVNPRNVFIKDRHRSASRERRATAPTSIGGGLIAESERLLIGDLGLAKNVILATSGVSMLGGTPGYQAPEQVDPAGEVQPATDIYAATAVMWEAITGSPPPSRTQLRQAVSSVEERWRHFFDKGMATEAGTRFQDMGSWLDAVLEVLGETDTVASDPSRSRVELQTQATNPYQGLASFQPEDAHLFFGRDSLVEELVGRLSRERVLVVGGASGSGKSSLVRAGLIPAVRSGALKESRRWPVVLFTPRSEPVKELAYQLNRTTSTATQRHTVPLTAEELPASPHQARAAAETITDATGGLLMVVDQFEELFTQTQSRETQQIFLDALAEMVDPVDSRARLVIVMRADFYAQSALFPWLADRINRNQVLVGPMSAPELRRAIEEPARQTGLRVEPELVDSILEDAHGDAGALPLISHAMAETWRRRKGTTLPLSSYQETGGVAGAITQTAESTYGDFDPDEQEAAQRLLLRLITPGEGSSDTRLDLPRSELDSDRAPTDMRRVAEALTEARLLTADEKVITIAHEALIGSWPRLRHWIDESRDALRTRQRIVAAAREWDEQGRDPGLLYRGTPLNAALEWAEEHGDDLPATAQQFLSTGEAEHMRQVEAETQAERRSRRLRTRAIAVLAMLLTVAVVASLVAFNSSREANTRLANQLATQASDLAEADPRLALALAVEAAERGAASFELRDALVTATAALESDPVVPAGSPIDVGDALTVSVHPEGEWAAVGLRQGGDISFVDLASGEPIGSPLSGHDKPASAIVFTPDGGTMISAGQDGAILVWDVADPGAVDEPVELGRSDDIVWEIDISPDGSLAVTAGEDGIVQLWDMEATGPAGEPLFDSARDALSAQFSPDGTIVLAGNGRGELMGWDVATREPLFEPFNAHDSDLWEIVFSPNGQMIATASSDGRTRLWDLEGSLLAEPFGGSEDVRGVQFFDDGRLLVAGDERGLVRVWDIAGEEETLVSQVGHGRQVIASSVSPNGATLVTLGVDHNIIPWALSSTSAGPMTGHVDGAYGLAVSPDGDRLASGDGAGEVRLFSPETGELVVGPIPVHRDAVWALAFTPDGNRLVAGDAGGDLAIIDVVTGDIVVSRTAAHDGAVRTVVVDDELILSGGDDGLVRPWDPALEPIGEPMGLHAGGVTDIAFSGAGTLAVSDRSGMVHFWDPTRGDSAGEPLSAEDNAIWGVAWSPDGTFLATASDDWAAHVWDASSHDLVATLTTLTQGGASVAFLGDGETLATTSRDGSIQLFDVALEREIGSRPRSHGSPSWGLAVFPDGVTYATSGEDGTVAIWDALDLDRACERADDALDVEQQRRFLGGAGGALGCR